MHRNVSYCYRIGPGTTTERVITNMQYYVTVVRNRRHGGGLGPTLVRVRRVHGGCCVRNNRKIVVTIYNFAVRRTCMVVVLITKTSRALNPWQTPLERGDPGVKPVIRIVFSPPPPSEISCPHT